METSCSSRDLASGAAYWILWGAPLGVVVLGAFLGGAAQAALWSLGFLVMGIACLVNAARCGRLHCFLTGPLFLVAALASALRGLGAVTVPWTWIGLAVLVGVFLAHLPEWVRGRYVTAARCR